MLITSAREKRAVSLKNPKFYFSREGVKAPTSPYRSPHILSRGTPPYMAGGRGYVIGGGVNTPIDPRCMLMSYLSFII